MKKLILFVPLAAILLVPGDVLSQRGGGRGGGGRAGGGGGGGARPARSNPTPSFSPASRPAARPSTPAARPSMPSRPSTPAARPSIVPQPRPTPPANIGGGGAGRPPINIGGGGAGRPPINIGGGGINRPGGDGGGRPPINPDRPNFPNIPGGGGGGRPPINPDRPNFPNIPGGGGGGRPPINPDRPNIGGGGGINIGGGGGGNNIINNRPIRPPDRPLRPADRPININNRPININNVRPGTRPWYDYHYHPWHNGYWGWWRPAGWFLGGAAAGWMLAPNDTNYVYSNPYYDQSSTTNVYDYTQPLPPPAEDPATNTQATQTADSATEIFDQARAEFKKGNYKEALALVDKAIKQLPTDATLHEFRALSLFALKDYKQAAATIYAVMAAGPGWDWDTMKGLYPDVQTYTEQLRALETYQKANPKSADASFLLAYHYLVLGYSDSAIKQLDNVVKLQPENQLAATLLKSLKTDANKPAPPPG